MLSLPLLCISLGTFLHARHSAGDWPKFGTQLLEKLWLCIRNYAILMKKTEGEFSTFLLILKSSVVKDIKISYKARKQPVLVIVSKMA